MGCLNRGLLSLSLFGFFCQAVWAAGPPAEDDRAFYSPDRKAVLYTAESDTAATREHRGCDRVIALAQASRIRLDLGKAIACQVSPSCYQLFRQEGMPWPRAAKDLGAGPLHVAVKYNNREMIKWLIQKTPQLLDNLDKEGRRPLLYAQNDAMVKFLLKHGATPPEEWVE